MTKNIEISGETRLVGFFASPARHSISPKMHNIAFKESGIDARYLAFDIKPEDLKVSIQAIRSLDLIGANKIVLSFLPQGFLIGLFLFISCIALFIFWQRWQRQKELKKD